MSTPFYPPPTPSAVQVRKAPRSGALIALIALVVLCGVAAVLLALLTMGEQQATESTAEASDTPTRVAAVPVNEKPPTIAEPLIEPLPDETAGDVSVSIETTPPGAEVFRSGESVGVTPVRTRLPRRAEAERWQLFLDGYVVEEVEVSLDADFHSELILKPLAAPVQRPTPATNVEPSPSTEPAVAKADEKNTDEKKGGDKDGKKSGGKKGGDKKPPKEEIRTVISGTTGASIPD
ncbi:MAG: hypothetical protein RBU37_06435 [Myxococcota bacterium]|nr:hypothetical protein [Myxococcota bacterium]